MTAPPREPTAQMFIAGTKALAAAEGSFARVVWQAMYDAASAPSAEPPAQAATDDLVQRLRDYSPFERQHVVHEAADLIERQAREIAMLRLAVKDDAQWAQENERLTRERDEWKCKCGDANVWGLRNAAAWKERAERSEAERDAMRECVLAADVMRAGYSVMWGERPTSTLDAYDAARAKVKP